MHSLGGYLNSSASLNVLLCYEIKELLCSVCFNNFIKWQAVKDALKVKQLALTYFKSCDIGLAVRVAL